MITTCPGEVATTPGQMHGAGAHSLWRRVQPRVSRRGHPVPCTAIRFQALLVTAIPGLLATTDVHPQSFHLHGASSCPGYKRGPLTGIRAVVVRAGARSRLVVIFGRIAGRLACGLLGDCGYAKCGSRI
jgi:hypothetical protein